MTLEQIIQFVIMLTAVAALFYQIGKSCNQRLR